MTYKNIIKLLKKHKVSTTAAHLATSCDSAWDENEEEIKERHPDMTFDDFCNIADNMWCDCEDNTGLTTIADWVAAWLIGHDEEPDSYSDLYDEYGY